MPQMRNPRILRTIPVLIAVCLAAFPGWARSVAASGLSGPAQTSRYVFLSDQSTLVQTGGIAGVHWTYAVQGQFQLTVDFQAGTACFSQVDANAIDDSPWRRTLDPNQVFAMAALVGTVISDTALEFTGKAANGSGVRITATLGSGQVHLVADTVPPPNSADFFLFSMDALAQRKYSGGTGEPSDPYQIATAADLILLGESPADYDKHFILTADIDLDPNLPGRRVFDRGVIAPISRLGGGTAFSGIFYGRRHTMSHMVIQGQSYLGLFGQLAPGAEVNDLGLVDVNVTGSGYAIGSLAGDSRGSVTDCNATGEVTGGYMVGGLVGINTSRGHRSDSGYMSHCSSTARVKGRQSVGGLIGENYRSVTDSYLAGEVTGDSDTGGLAGLNYGSISNCHSSGKVTGGSGGYGKVGGLVGSNYGGGVADCYSTAEVTGMTGSSLGVGGLVGCNDYYGNVANCRSTGRVSGVSIVGGLVGSNSGYYSSVANCRSTGQVSGVSKVGGLVGCNGGNLACCYSEGKVTGSGDYVGGLVGWNGPGSVVYCCSTGQVAGISCVGGLVGRNEDGCVANCHSSGSVTGAGGVGGLIGTSQGRASIVNCYSIGNVERPGGSIHVGGLVGYNEGHVDACFQDSQASGICYSIGRAGGDWRDVHGLVGYSEGQAGSCFEDTQGRTTVEMQDIQTYLRAGWDFVGADDGPGDIWVMPEGGGYPLLWWQLDPLPPLPTFGGGNGMPDAPYLIVDANDLNSIGANPRLMGSCFKITTDIDLRQGRFYPVGNELSPFTGTFDGNGHRISNLTYDSNSTDYVGLVGLLGAGGAVKDLGVVNVRVTGHSCVGGLVGRNEGSVANCCGSGPVTGTGDYIGGLVGENRGTIENCYSSSPVTGRDCIGGLAGYSGWKSSALIINCYSIGMPTGVGHVVGGLVGYKSATVGRVDNCFWDIDTSGQSSSLGGMGLTTAQMQTASTFLDAGWDFVGETKNGTADIWWIDEGKDYPRLSWELDEDSVTTSP